MPQIQLEQRRLRILVVEDNGLLRKLFSEAFRGKHMVYSASGAEEGWKLYIDHAPHIIFLDIGLPDASGHELARRIRQHTSTAYIIMATASDYKEDAEEARQNQVDGFITKPFDKGMISNYIDKYLATQL